MFNWEVYVYLRRKYRMQNDDILNLKMLLTSDIYYHCSTLLLQAAIKTFTPCECGCDVRVGAGVPL